MKTTALRNKSASKMVKIMKSQDLSYNHTGKEEFKKTSTAALRQIAKDLELSQSKVSFNAGGIAVGGDATLMGLWNDGNGIYVNISPDGFGEKIMYRTIKHMKDYTGGINQWLSLDVITDDYESFIEKLARLRN